METNRFQQNGTRPKRTKTYTLEEVHQKTQQKEQPPQRLGPIPQGATTMNRKLTSTLAVLTICLLTPAIIGCSTTTAPNPQTQTPIPCKPRTPTEF